MRGDRPRLAGGLFGPLGVVDDGDGELLHGGRGLFNRGRLLGGALGKVVGTGEDFAGGGLQPARGRAQLAHHLGEVLNHGIGIGLELGEGAAVVALHLLGEVGAGQGGEHVAGLAEAAIHGFDEAVDALGDAHQVRVLERDANAMREIALNRGVDDFTQFLDQGGHGTGAFAGLAGAHRFGGVELFDLQGVLLEHLHGGRHVADFVRATDIGNVSLQLVIGEGRHALRDLADRLGD